MRELEDDVRRARRKRLLARGGAADYRDEAIYERVDTLIRRALEARDHDALLLPDLLSGEDEWQLSLHLRFNSHRSVLGPLLIFLKKNILLPINRWLWEYSLENFRKQRRVNAVLFACVEELAIENAKLRAGLAEAPRDSLEGSRGRASEASLAAQSHGSEGG